MNHSQVMFYFFIFFFFHIAILLYHYEPTGVESVIDWSRAKAMLSWAFLQSHKVTSAKLATSEISISSSLKCFEDVTLSKTAVESLSLL